MFSCEFCEISKNIFLTEHLRTTTSQEAIKFLSPCAEKNWYFFVALQQQKRKKRLIQLETVHKKTRFFNKDCFSKCDQIRSFQKNFFRCFLMEKHLMQSKKCLMKNWKDTEEILHWKLIFLYRDIGNWVDKVSNLNFSFWIIHWLLNNLFPLVSKILKQRFSFLEAATRSVL